MYETFDGIMSIMGGLIVWLLATGKINSAQSEEMRKKHGRTMKVVGPFLIIFGILRLTVMR